MSSKCLCSDTTCTDGALQQERTVGSVSRIDLSSIFITASKKYRMAYY